MSQTRFAKYAWTVLGANLLVILWGAVVRATGSGAGCGAHWPRCNGEIVPLSYTTETAIEFGHRASSGIALLAVLGLMLWARRAFAAGHRVRTAAAVSMIVIVIEALVGLMLVRFGWVEDDASVGRAITIAVHLVNTLLLIGSLALTAWWASGAKPARLEVNRPAGVLLGLGLAGLMVVGAAGAVTALGDTLFPAESFAEGFRADLSPYANFLIRLRVIHPVAAVATGIFLAVVSSEHRRSTERNVRVLATAVTALVFVQLVAGTVNLALLAPLWMQIVHLLLADLLWVAAVLLAAAVLAAPVHTGERTRHAATEAR